MKLGFIGLGNMGRPMAIHLLEHGYALTIHNRSRAVVAEIAARGAVASSSPAEVVAAADIVLTCLPNTSAVEDVYFGPDGLIETVGPGQILVDHSTVGLALSRRCAAEAAGRNAFFFDAPVSGGTAGARAGKLTAMVGGDRGEFDQISPVLQAYCRNIHYVGASGTGTVVKLVNQLLTGINVAGIAEALVLGTKAGADPRTMIDVLSTSFGGSMMLTRSAPIILERQFNTGAAIDLLHKDLNLIDELADGLGVRLLLGAMARQTVREARAAGFGKDDLAGVIKMLESRAGVIVSGKGGRSEEAD